MADPKAAAETAEASAEPAGPKLILGLPLLHFVLYAANALIMAGGLGYVVHASLIYKKPVITDAQVAKEVTKKEEKRHVQAGDGYFPVSYNEMTITLRSESGGKGHFATVETTLVCGTEDCQGQLEATKAKVEDTIQSVLSSRSYTELSSLETKFRVKHEILGKVNSFMRDTAVLDVLFTNFVVQ